jgi:glutamyl-tRNA(Gln) amidotransferase subunit D
MYSKEIEEMLLKKGISPGDTIRVVFDRKSFEGVLIPKPEFGDPHSLVLKLRNGYNIGIAIKKGAKIEKLERVKESFSFPRIELKERKELPNVTIITTGGTVGSSVDYATGGVRSVVDPHELLYAVPELQDIANFKMLSPMRIMSEDMLSDDWQLLARETAKALSDSEGVVITHGTDTMHYTAAALSFMLEGLSGPVVLTGAQRSSDRGSSDSFMNLICASQFAGRGDAAEVGICMHASSSDNFCNFIRGTKVRKMHTTRRDAFRPINNRPIARIDASGKIDYIEEYRRRRGEGGKLHVNSGYESRVALLKFYPNSDPEIIDYYISKHFKGLIIEGTGMGHVAISPKDEKYSWLNHIKRAVDAGIVVGMTSQCLNGRVNPNVYANLRIASAAGVIYCEDMLPEVALVKLGVLLGNHKRQEAARLLNKNIAGEITERSEIDWFP